MRAEPRVGFLRADRAGMIHRDCDAMSQANAIGTRDTEACASSRNSAKGAGIPCLSPRYRGRSIPYGRVASACRPSWPRFRRTGRVPGCCAGPVHVDGMLGADMSKRHVADFPARAPSPWLAPVLPVLAGTPRGRSSLSRLPQGNPTISSPWMRISKAQSTSPCSRVRRVGIVSCGRLSAKAVEMKLSSPADRAKPTLRKILLRANREIWKSGPGHPKRKPRRAHLPSGLSMRTAQDSSWLEASSATRRMTICTSVLRNRGAANRTIE